MNACHESIPETGGTLSVQVLTWVSHQAGRSPLPGALPMLNVWWPRLERCRGNRRREEGPGARKDSWRGWEHSVRN